MTTTKSLRANNLMLFIFCALLSTGALAQSQLGGDLNGEGDEEFSGWSVSLSSDGGRLAIGAPHNPMNVNSGHVRVYQWSAGAWTQMGADIDGEAVQDHTGDAVSFSADGNRLAIGGPKNSENGQNAGHVRVFQWSGTAWGQIGGDIDGEAAGILFGAAVSLSADGNTLAIGAWKNNDNGEDSGHVRVFRWAANAWSQLGDNIAGGNLLENSGWAVSLSADGLILATGAPHVSTLGSDAGRVRIYEWSGSEWTQRGSTIVGAADDDVFGTAVSLSANGNRLAIGGPKNNDNGSDSGHVRVYQWSGGAWAQLGEDINGTAANDHFGSAVSLSANGGKLAIGAPKNDANGSDSGHVRLYQWSGSIWTRFGADIIGEAAGDESGHSLSLSPDGNRLSIGAPFNSGNGSRRGHVRVYDVQASSNGSVVDIPTLASWSILLLSALMLLAAKYGTARMRQ